MRKLGIVCLSVLATLFIGCGDSDGPGTGVSAQTAPAQCYSDENYRALYANSLCAGVASVSTAPDECYSDANFRAQYATTACASVPNNLPAQCYTDATYRANNIYGACSGTTTNTATNTYTNPFGTNTGVFNNGATTGYTQYPTTQQFTQVATSCGDCQAGSAWAIDAHTGGFGRCYQPSKTVTAHQLSAYAGVNYNSLSGVGSSTQFEFGITGSIRRFKVNNTQQPVNSCQGNNGLLACTLSGGHGICQQRLGNNQAQCLVNAGETTGFCAVIDAYGNPSY